MAELDEKAEELSQLRSSNYSSTQAAADYERQLAQVREQALRQAELLSAAEGNRATLEQRLEQAEKTEARLLAEGEATESELGATADDLRKMIRENQILNEELQTTAAGGEAARRELQQAGARVTYLEQLAKASEDEKAELLAAYRGLGDEAAALRLSLQQTGAERDRSLAQILALEQEVAEVQATCQTTYEENAKLLVDQQAYARQNEQLVAQLAALENALQQCAACPLVGGEISNRSEE
ncbi:MAG: hypothetical protein SGPRY_003810 [Prymnesium sp.]